MKILLFLLFFFVLSVANAEEEEVVVGNPGSRNNLQVNQFYVISQPRPQQYNSQTIVETPETRETFSTENDTLLIDSDNEFSSDRF